MGTLITLFIIVAVVIVLVWLVNLVPNPGMNEKGFSILKFLAIAIIVLVAIMKVWPLL